MTPRRRLSARDKPVATTRPYMVNSLLTEKAMAWIVSDADHLGGKPRVRDTRISVTLLLEWLAAGMTIGEIAKEYPVSRKSRFAENWKN